jgi:hypothetical protein
LVNTDSQNCKERRVQYSIFAVTDGYDVHQGANHMELEDAEDTGAVHCGGRVLLSINGLMQGLVY